MSTDVTPEVRQTPLAVGVAEEIRALLGRRQIRQSQLARQLQVTEQWLSVRLRGLHPLDLNDFDRIARELKVEIIDLIPKDRRTATLPYSEPRPTMAPTRPPGHPAGPTGPGRTPHQHPPTIHQPGGFFLAGKPTKDSHEASPVTRRQRIVTSYE
jgi:transcriptional regulator with XRE-family HTH domain